MLPHKDVFSAVYPLLSNNEIGLMTTPLTYTLIEFGIGYISFTIIQSDELPSGSLFWNLNVISSGGIDAKVILYVLCKGITETNLPNLLFKG